MLLAELVCFTAEAVPLRLQLFVEPQLMFVHLSLQLVLQSHQLLLVLPPHALVSGHLLSERRALLVLLDLTGHQRGRADGGEVIPSPAPAAPRGALLLGVHLRLVGVVVDVIMDLWGTNVHLGLE